MRRSSGYNKTWILGMMALAAVGLNGCQQGAGAAAGANGGLIRGVGQTLFGSQNATGPGSNGGFFNTLGRGLFGAQQQTGGIVGSTAGNVFGSNPASSFGTTAGQTVGSTITRVSAPAAPAQKPQISNGIELPSGDGSEISSALFPASNGGAETVADRIPGPEKLIAASLQRERITNPGAPPVTLPVEKPDLNDQGPDRVPAPGSEAPALTL